MHHRLFRSRGGLWTPSNVILLCPEHHLDTTNERLGGTGLNCQSWESPNEVPVEVWYEDGAVFLDDEGGYRLIG